VNRKRVLRVMRERSLLVRSRHLRARRKKEWGRVEAARPNQIWQIGYDQDLGRTDGGLGVSSECNRLLHTGNRGMESFASLPDVGSAGCLWSKR